MDKMFHKSELESESKIYLMSVFQTAGWTKEAIYSRLLSSQRYCDFS